MRTCIVFVRTMLRTPQMTLFSVFLCLWQARLTGGGQYMFSSCPFVRPSVRLWTNLWNRYFENEWTYFNAKWHIPKWSSGQGREPINFEDHSKWQMSKSDEHEAEDLDVVGRACV